MIGQGMDDHPDCVSTCTPLQNQLCYATWVTNTWIALLLRRPFLAIESCFVHPWRNQVVDHFKLKSRDGVFWMEVYQRLSEFAHTKMEKACVTSGQVDSSGFIEKTEMTEKTQRLYTSKVTNSHLDSYNCSWTAAQLQLQLQVQVLFKHNWQLCYISLAVKSKSKNMRANSKIEDRRQRNGKVAQKLNCKPLLQNSFSLHIVIKPTRWLSCPR